MSQGTSRSDWTYSDVHHRLMTETDVKKRLELWDEYALIYDDAAAEMDWQGPAQTADRILDMLETYPVPSGQKIRLLDIGCGTGLLGEHLKKLGMFDKAPIHLIGLDFKESMLEFARKKNSYHELICDDFRKVSFPDGPADFLTASGVFWQGDYGPETLPDVLQFVKEGGYASITVRRKWFVENEKGFEEGVDKCGCDLLSNAVLPYIGGKVEANYLLIRKRVAA